MIKNKEYLSMSEVLEYLEKTKDGKSEIKGFIKKFTKLSTKDSDAMRKKLNALDLIKLKEEYIVKIIDIFPEDSEELNKIFTEISLNEDETKKILDTIKEFK